MLDNLHTLPTNTKNVSNLQSKVDFPLGNFARNNKMLKFYKELTE